MKTRIKVIGAGFAGAEAAYRLLTEGFSVDLYEMRPNKMTPAHHTGGIAEPVCSNSFKSKDRATAQGLLKAEMRELDSVVLRAADRSAVPAGGALAVDRELFSANIQEILLGFPRLRIIREEAVTIDDYTIVASGPLTSDTLAAEIISLTGREGLAFYDAAAPIVTAESVDMSKAYYMSRYGKGDADYLNCPMSREEYQQFYQALVSARTVILKDFEKGDVFEGCLPLEVMAKRGEDTLRFGAFKPVGLSLEGERAYAVLQLRKENVQGTLFNLVGCQTNLAFPEQKRVFSLISALKGAEFVRYGVMHRNTFIDSPALLTEHFNMKERQSVFFAGQLTGVEGYMESAASGIIAGINMARLVRGEQLLPLPSTTMVGSLARYISTSSKDFQPMHASFELVPPLSEKIKDKKQRKIAYANRAINDIIKYRAFLK
ncbi:MAG: FADH(2)-oxidizing methylenetetrahydrofolate--tRNA-(uracil(54)-C(5))-methyltransferase TrmFO [Clostridia bacterium]